ncbi:MAG: hypothetical protein JXA28_06415 [Bacteroidetes bacterium]|nr:hypothetical protein [Bacteroidota bacterium]
MPVLHRVVFPLLAVLLSVPATAQDSGTSWSRSAPDELPPLQLFHSTQAANLPTAEVLQQGNFEFEISHRFIPTISDGAKSLWGFDGPVNIRLALGYAYSDHGYVTLGRSNEQDNLDLHVKQQLFSFRHEVIPLLAAVRLGAAWNTDVPDRDAADAATMQYYAQLIVNTMFDERFAVGIVPSYLENSHIACPERQYSFLVGVHAQYYITDVFNVLAEWIPTVSGWRTAHNSVAFGIELETGGHFFKIILTNTDLLNPSQVLAGAANSFNDGDWHIGFNITRLLAF